MDRTVATGTGFIGQYRPPVAARFESLETCPDELLLFMHHVPYTHKLHSGKTVIQYFYDSHYQGAADAAAFVSEWQQLKGHIDDRRYDEVLQRLEYQAGHAQVWRDSICRWFMKISGIRDEKGRVGNYPNRVEAEDCDLKGYEFTEIKPWEAASGRGAVQLPDGVESGSIRFRFTRDAGDYDVRVQYFDEEDGVSKFTLFVNDKRIDAWQADNHLPTPTTLPDAHSSIRRKLPRVKLNSGDEIRLEGTADAGERAVVDYFELMPSQTDHSFNAAP
jgi:alpha-glucuronidase